MAAELVGGALLSASLEFLLERLGSPAVLAYLRGKSKHRDSDELLAKLRSQLNLVGAVLDDAEQKQAKSRSIEKWLEELHDAFYDVEDLLYEIETDALQLKVEAGSTTGSSSKVRESKKQKLHNFFSRFRRSNSSNGDMESRIKKILERLEYIAEQAGVLNLVEGTAQERPSWKPLPSTSLVDQSEVYGRDDDKKEIIKLLLSDEVGKDDNIIVIPLVGMGGVGKTTLAQAIINDDQLKDHFELKAWVCVSEDFDIFRVTKSILAAVSGAFCDNSMDLNLLQVKLKDSLSGKKFLIVLDDVWNEKYADWEVMRMPFQDGARGSRIIITTRSEDVASVMRTRSIPTHHLKELDEEVCWKLFAKHAFGSTDDFSPNPDLERIGRKIVKKCKGLPLAAKTLGGLLRSKSDVEQWERVSKSEIWELPDERSDILPALRLSFHYLPSHLKRCFAYCSIFPKDFQFKKENLVLQWMAEGLLENPKGNKTVEEVGHEYFDDLLCRSFFQKPGAKKSFFVMHDLISDLAKFVAGKYCFRLENGNSSKMESKTRHLACVMAKERHDLCESFKSILEATHLRTFLQMKNFATVCSLLEVVLKLRSLRVLSLSCYKMYIVLPDSIGELRQLRYLDLSTTSIDGLPESVCMLYNLQTLLLQGCRKLTKLPTDFHCLVNLRYLDVEGSGLVDMPTQMGKLKSLRRLSTFIVGKENGMKIGELGELLDLKGSLHIKNLHNVVTATEASEAKLRDKKCLEELEFEWGGEADDSEHESKRHVLDHLLPGSVLKKLKLTRYGGRKFPDWLGGHLVCNLVDVNLSDCNYCDSLPPLGQLSSLKSVEISWFNEVVRVGPEFYGNSSSFVKPFVSLEILKFNRMSKWEEWSIPFDVAEPFPKLRELSISHCKKLKGDLPRFLPYLKELIIRGCPELASSLPMVPDVDTLGLVDCDRLIGGYDVVESLGCLQHLEISKSLDSTTCKSLPRTLKKLTFMRNKNLEIPTLHSYDCPNLTELRIRLCNLITSRMSWNSQGLPNLKTFLIQSSTFENKYCCTFPKEGLLPTTITKLDIWLLDWLKILDSNGLQQLTSLKSLLISNCSNLQTIAQAALPSSLEYLRISYCPMLEGKLERDKGVYWNKISHIPQIYINFRPIS